MTPHTNRIVASAAAFVAAFAFAATANAVPMADNGGSTPSSLTLSVRPDDRAAVRGAVANESQAVSSSSVARGENSFGANDAVQLSPGTTGSGYDGSKTVGISAGGAALALCLAGLALVGVRQRKVQPSV